MKFTINWLKEHLDTDASDEKICETLTNIGLELEEFEDVAAQYAPFKVAYVESAEKHPDADKLQVCKVKTEDGIIQVVCGAPNARAGMKGIFAPDKTYIPGLDVTLKKTKIRGVESCGMLVSEKEMCLSDEHKGIIEVDDSYEIGTPMADIFGLNEKIVEIGLTPNRADCAGVYGIARDLAAAGLGTLKIADESPVTGSFKSNINVKIEDDGCNLFYGRLIKGVKNGPSPKWLQDKLTAIGLRPISALVDITNLMTMDFARPLHVYDADKLSGDIIVRTTKEGEEIDALNDKSYKTVEGAIGITDNSGLIGLGGIVGGVSTSCDEETVNVFLESAYFEPMRIARAGRDMNVSSDARYRFDRGVDPEFTRSGIEIATRLIQEICGNENTEISEIVKAGNEPKWQRSITFDPAFTQKLCGVDIPQEEQEKILTDLGFKIEGNQVSPPSWRGDIEGKPDLVEEVVRIYGVDKIEPVSVTSEGAVTKPAETLSLNRARTARAAMCALGLNECVTWSFMGEDTAAAFGSNDNAALKLSNPISNDLVQMRPSILPNLIEAAQRNLARGYANAALCEVGPVFNSQKMNGQSYSAAAIRTGEKIERNWHKDSAARSVDFYDIKADVLNVLEACGAPAANAQITKDAPDYYHPGRSAVLRLGKNIIAQFGEIHPAILEEMGIKTTIVGFEILLDNIPQARKKGTAKPLLKVEKLQPVSKDFAFIVKDDVAANDVIKTAIASNKKLISDARVFDVYAGKGIEDGHKSLALSITIQPKDETLTDEDIEGIMNGVIDTISSKCGGVLRG